MTEARDWFKNPPPRRVGALALITRGTQLLLVSRPYRTAVSKWGLPGGSAAANERPRSAVSRHLAEKLSLRATAGRLLVVDHIQEKPGQHHEGINFVYSVEIPADAEPAVTETSGLEEARWVDRGNVGELAVDQARHRIEQCVVALYIGQTLELLHGLPLPADAPTA